MTFSRSIFYTTAFALTLAASSAAHAADKVTIMVGGYEKQIYLPAKLAEGLGYFKDEGLEVELLNEAAGVSRDLSRTGEIGLETLARMRTRQTTPDWIAATLAELDRLGKPQIEVVLAAVRPVRQLVLLIQRAAR